jgi:hypothetical protein
MKANFSGFLLVVGLSTACGQVHRSETGGGDTGGGGQLGEGGSSDGGTNAPGLGTVVQKDADYRAMAVLNEWPNCSVTGVNAHGHAVGYCSKSLTEPVSVAVRWPSLDADPVVLPVPPGLDPELRWYVTPKGINDAGVIVGEATAYPDEGDSLFAIGIRWVAEGDSYEPKPFSTPEDGFVISGGINAYGEIAGGIRTPGAEGDEYGGFVWKDGSFEMVAPFSSNPADYLADVVGFNTSHDILLAPGQVFVDGVRTFLPLPLFEADSTSCTGVNEEGTAIGSNFMYGGYRGLTWTRRLGYWTWGFLPRVFPDAPVTSDMPSAIGAEGDIAGTTMRLLADGATYDFHVVVWTRQGPIFDLGNVPASWSLAAAIPTPKAILGDGTVVANLSAVRSGATIEMPIVIAY